MAPGCGVLDKQILNRHVVTVAIYLDPISSDSLVPEVLDCHSFKCDIVFIHYIEYPLTRCQYSTINDYGITGIGLKSNWSST